MGNVSDLADYLLSHSTGETWLVAVPGSMGSGAELIIETGKPVMSLGGFSGSDEVLTLDTLKQMIASGDIRYFYLSGSQGGGAMNSGNSAIFSWVRESCTAIPSSAWSGANGTTEEIMGIPAMTGSGNLSLPGVQGGMPGSAGTGVSAAGGQNTLYDCAGAGGLSGA
jgi:hypothetical protein